MSPAKKRAKKTAKKRAAKPKRKVAAKGRAAAKRGVAAKGMTPAKRRAATKGGTVARRKAAVKRKVAAKRKLTAKRGDKSLKLVRRPVRRKVKPAPPPFAGATANASAKDLVLFEMVRARVQVHAAIQGLSAAVAERPTAPGKWSTREMILHLAFWDREVLGTLEDAYAHGRGMGLTKEDILRMNPIGVDELRHHDWESAKRLLQSSRERLLESLQSLPEEPASMWTREHPIGKICAILIHHDRHHADVLKEARTRSGG
jgi:hypothetical protein